MLHINNQYRKKST